MHAMHQHRDRSWCPIGRLSLALAALPFLLIQGNLSAQTARPPSSSPSGEVHPSSIGLSAGSSIGGWLAQQPVWIRIPSSASAPVDVELTAEPRPPLLTVESTPPVRSAVAPGAIARFDVSFDARPSFTGASFALVFRDHSSGAELGEIPVDIEKGTGVNPRAAKEAAVLTLLELRDEIAGGAFEVGDRDAAIDEIEDAAEEIQESLDSELWARTDSGDIDPERLDPEEGEHVFHEEREGAHEVFDAIREGEISDEGLRDDLLAVVDSLVAADRALAEVAIQDAVDAGGDPEEIEEALDELAEGDALVEAAAGQSNLSRKAAFLYSAMDGAYRHAWESAIDAVETDSE